MYNFIDVTEVQEASESLLPSEALSINGEYIENLIDGYRTLHVSGREALSPEIESFETGIRDGSDVLYKRYPARTITVTYQLRAKTNEDFRNAYNKLASILNVSDALLIFRDEQDLFFTGTLSAIGEIEPGRNSVVGEFELFCADPFKYSLVEYEAYQSLDESSVLIDYKGTYKASPTLVAEFYRETEVNDNGETETLTGAGDCGYIAFFTEDEQIVQLGDPEETDTEKKYEKSQTLANQTFQSSNALSTAAKNLWKLNSGHLLTSDVQQSGDIAMKVASYAVPANPKQTSATVLYRKATPRDQPTFYYTVSLKSSVRTANSIRIDVSITTALKYAKSYFGRPFSLRGSLYIGGAWRSATIKNPSEFWRGQSGHVANMSFTITGLSAAQTSLTGIQFKVDRTDSVGGEAGILPATACSNFAISNYVADVPETYYLAPSSFGSAAGKWHGVSMTKTIGADTSGEVGAKDFTLTYKQKMCIGSGSTGQMGAFQAVATAANGKNVAGVRITKNSAGNSADVTFYLNGAKVDVMTIDLSYGNYNFGSKENAVKTSTISKVGNKVTFNIAGTTKTFIDDAIKDVKTTEITFAFEQYSTTAALSYNGLYWVKFVKNNCEQYRDIPNKFSANDVVEADCKNGEIRLNGVETPALGAMGNDWETFVLTPGLNQIGTSYSDWVEKEYKPSFKIRYREVFL